MADILDYIEWRGDLTFREREFNDVDNLILSLLAYSDFKGIISMDEGSPPISIAELYSKYVEAGKNQSELACNPKPVFEKCAKTNRFGNIMVKDYVDIVNQGRQFQFAAMTFQLGDGTVYAAFRGTDNTLVEWREDLNFSFMEATPAQLCAAEYLDIVCEKTNDPVRTGGHSKGGNLAMYAAAFCEDQNKDRIVRVYSNDGPGFNEIIAENENRGLARLSFRRVDGGGRQARLLQAGVKWASETRACWRAGLRAALAGGCLPSPALYKPCPCSAQDLRGGHPGVLVPRTRPGAGVAHPCRVTLKAAPGPGLRAQGFSKAASCSAEPCTAGALPS